MADNPNPLEQSLKVISTKFNADVAIFNAAIDSRNADSFIELILEKKDKKDNLALILTTRGGEPDAGYRIVKCIKRHYKRFVLFVFGMCKSTGTLMALGADEIVMTEFGEFGPLDIQLTKDDELKNTSGLSYLQSLFSLNDHQKRFFEAHFLQIKVGSGNTITTKTAAHIASELTTGLIAPISSQIDPIKLGEVLRAIKIAEAYGERLAPAQGALIQQLISGYPSHSFVIDKEEAEKLFENVRDATDEELVLEKLLRKGIREEASQPFINIFNVVDATKSEDTVSENKHENSTTQQTKTERHESLEPERISNNNGTH